MDLLGRLRGFSDSSCTVENFKYSERTGNISVAPLLQDHKHLNCGSPGKRSKSNLEVAESVCDPKYWLSHWIVNVNYKDDAVSYMLR